MKKLLILFLALVTTSIFVSCDSDDDAASLNYVAFQNEPSNVEVEFNGSTTYDVKVYTANVVGSDRTFNIRVSDASSLSAEAYAVPATVTVPGGSNEGVFTIDVADVNIGPVGETLILNFAPQEGLFIGDPITINVAQICPFPEFRINFAFDGYASETTWEIMDAEGNVIFDGGGFSDGTGTASVKRCLDAGTYSFTVYDAYGDGLTYPNEGSVTLTYGGEELVVIPGDFGESATVEFTLD